MFLVKGLLYPFLIYIWLLFISSIIIFFGRDKKRKRSFKAIFHNKFTFWVNIKIVIFIVSIALLITSYDNTFNKYSDKKDDLYFDNPPLKEIQLAVYIACSVCVVLYWISCIINQIKKNKYNPRTNWFFVAVIGIFTTFYGSVFSNYYDFVLHSDVQKISEYEKTYLEARDKCIEDADKKFHDPTWNYPLVKLDDPNYDNYSRQRDKDFDKYYKERENFINKCKKPAKDQFDSNMEKKSDLSEAKFSFLQDSLIFNSIVFIFLIPLLYFLNNISNTLVEYSILTIRLAAKEIKVYLRFMKSYLKKIIKSIYNELKKEFKK